MEEELSKQTQEEVELPPQEKEAQDQETPKVDETESTFGKSK
jgi:hypothetical protein